MGFMLSIPSWTPDLTVDNETIDQQHHEMLALGRTAIYLLKHQNTPLFRQQLPDIMDKILELTSRHFVTEERILARNGCPTLAEHQHQHQQHLNTLDELVRRAKEGRIDGMGFIKALVSSLYNHMYEWDLACKEFLRKESTDRRFLVTTHSPPMYATGVEREGTEY
jgi:hemerythrin-like metal-binding protein